MSFRKLIITKVATKLAEATRVTFDETNGGTVSGTIGGLNAESTTVYASDTAFMVIPGNKSVEGDFVILDAEKQEINTVLHEFAGDKVDSLTSEIKTLTQQTTVEVALAYIKINNQGKAIVSIVPRAVLSLSDLAFQTSEESNTVEGYEITFKGLPLTDNETGESLSVITKYFDTVTSPDLMKFVDKYHYKSVTDLPPSE